MWLSEYYQRGQSHFLQKLQQYSQKKNHIDGHSLENNLDPYNNSGFTSDNFTFFIFPLRISAYHGTVMYNLTDNNNSVYEHILQQAKQ